MRGDHWNGENSTYRELLTRRRWPLKIGYWMLVGIYLEETTSRVQRIDTIKDGKLKDTLDRELKKLDELEKEEIALHEEWDNLSKWQKVKRILKRRREEKSSPITDEMLDYLYSWETLEHMRYIRVTDFTALEDCFGEDGEIIENELWEAGLKHEELDIHKRFRSTVDINYCEIPYRDPETGTAYPFATDSEWSVEAFIEFGKREGLDIKWLIDDIKMFSKELERDYDEMAWSVKPRTEGSRERDYDLPLRLTLDQMYEDHHATPNEHSVLALWKERKTCPQGIQTSPNKDGFEYKKGDKWIPVTPKALGASIRRKITKNR